MDSAVLLETSSILKNKLPNPVKKSNVHFEGDPIIIGYCDDDSGNEEEPESNYSSSEDEDGKVSDEDDCELSKLTESNTKFNSLASNLRQVSNQLNKGLFKSEAKLNGDSLHAHLKSSLDNISDANDMVTTTSNSNSESISCLNHADSNNFGNDDKVTVPVLISSLLVKDGDFKKDNNEDSKVSLNGHLKQENEFQKLKLIKESSKSNHVNSKLDIVNNKDLSESGAEVHEKPTKPERINRRYKSLSLINSKSFNRVLEINPLSDEENTATTGSLHFNKKQRSFSQDSTKSLQDLSHRELRLAELAQELELVRNHPKRQAPLPPCFQQNNMDSKFTSSSRIKLLQPLRPPSITSFGKFSIKKWANSKSKLKTALSTSSSKSKGPETQETDDYYESSPNESNHLTKSKTLEHFDSDQNNLVKQPSLGNLQPPTTSEAQGKHFNHLFNLILSIRLEILNNIKWTGQVIDVLLFVSR